MIAHLARIAAAEGFAVEPEALALIARVAEGSVRDALSLLDQAIAYGGAGGVAEPAVRDMLGLSDRGGIVTPSSARCEARSPRRSKPYARCIAPAPTLPTS